MSHKKLFDIIQANVLKAHNRNYLLLIFFSWKENKETGDYRNWVKRIGTLVTTHTEQLKGIEAYKKSGEQSFVVNLGLNARALNLMQTQKLATDTEFVKGMNYSPTVYFGPVYRKAPSNLDEADNLLATDKHHAVLCVAHDRKKKLKDYLKNTLSNTNYEALLSLLPVTLIIKQKRHRKRSGEKKGRPMGPFAMEDNISNITKEEDILKHAFNYENDQTATHTDRGTYMALQKIQLYKKGFIKNARCLAKELKKKQPLANISLGKALLVGRFKNGTPLATHQQSTSCQRNDENDFSYQSDTLGSKCPMHAHTRSTNPRIKNNDPVPIVRRGIVYQEKRGGRSEEALLFLSYQTSIKNNLLPVYKRMLQGGSVSSPWRTDALVYPHRNFPTPLKPLNYYPDYGTNDKSTVITYPRVGQEITAITSGAFYYCPSKTFLNDPKNI